MMTHSYFSSVAFLESPDSKRISAQISKAYDEFCLAVKAGRRFEAKGIAILGPTGTGKTEGTMQALEALGMVETEPGDTERPLLKLDLGARATLKSLSSDILEELGWPEMPRSSGQHHTRILQSDRTVKGKRLRWSSNRTQSPGGSHVF